MGLGDITSTSIIQAIEECDEMGAQEFLARYGYAPARTYRLTYEGRQYDSKAIVGVAHRFVQGDPLRSADFSGGEQTVAKLLSRLGFEVRRTKNPDWTRDEVILACSLVQANDWHGLDGIDSRVQDLSMLLRRLPIHPAHERDGTFRNPNGVSRKTYDIATAHPDYPGRRTHGGTTDREVLTDFLSDPAGMQRIAKAIQDAASRGSLDDLVPNDDSSLDDIEAPEGRLLVRQHVTRERSAVLRAKKIAATIQSGHPLSCQACGFDFETVYGERGAGYIECHHVVPLHETGERRNSLRDLVLLCSNCHRIIHRQSPWLTPDEVSGLIAARFPLHRPGQVDFFLGKSAGRRRGNGIFVNRPPSGHQES